MGGVWAGEGEGRRSKANTALWGQRPRQELDNVRQTWAGFPAEPLPGCVRLDELTDFSVPHFLFGKLGDVNSKVTEVFT